jgi:peptidoglycan/xylan/chitin deacetylase (PgdA/CDA1 family)
VGESMKRLIKYVIAVVIYYSGLLPLLSKLKPTRQKRRWPIVLMYHRVIEQSDITGLQPGMYVTIDSFDRQATYLSRKYNVLSMADFVSGLSDNREYNYNDLLITFDDGWRDNYENAFPILKKYRVPATIYLATDFIGTNRNFWFQEISSILTRQKNQQKQIADILSAILAKYHNSSMAGKLLSENMLELVADTDRCIERLKQLEPEINYEIVAELGKLPSNNPITNLDDRQLLDWDEVLLMNKENINFGSHGLSHKLMNLLDLSEVTRELTESKKIIEERLGKSVSTFTYPNGNCNEEIIKLTEQAGYACAFIAGKNRDESIKNDKFAIERIGVHNDISIGLTGKFSKAMFALHIYRNAY